ncbi:flagellar biosynthesis anti-sigma factor FlgM [Azotobacter armeniacus]
MKIDSSTLPTAAQLPEIRETSPRIRRDEPLAQPESPAAIAHISQAAEADATQDIDIVRVAEIRQAIGEGRLQIRPERIAEGLIESVRELLDDAGA